MSKNIKLHILTLITILLITTSCGSIKAPIVERDNAIKEIEFAKLVDAEKYAEKELSTSEKDFSLGEALIDRTKKSKKNIKSKKQYISAFNFAKQAYRKSIYPYLFDLIKRTDEIINEAESNSGNTTTIKMAKNTNQSALEKLKEKEFVLAKNLTLVAREIIGDINFEKLNEIEYRIAKNDNLWKISKIILNNPNRWIEIYNRNIKTIKDSNTIFPNQTLLITIKGGNIIDKYNFYVPKDKNIYVVYYKNKNKQSLWQIAKQKLGSGKLWKDLFELNKNTISNPNIIYPGQRIRLK